MKKLFFTLIFISGVAIASFGQNATTKKKWAPAATTAADKQAAAAAAETPATSATDLDPASFAGAVNGAQPKTSTTKKYVKAKAASKATPAIKAN